MTLCDAIFRRMNFVAPYELRALIEELLAASDEPAREEVAAAMRVWLRLHCRSCGTLIDHDLRRRGEEYCFVCFPPPPPDLDMPPPPGLDEVPF